MDFGSNRQGFSEADEMGKVKLHFSSYSSSSSPSSSSSQHQQMPLLYDNNTRCRWESQLYENNHQILLSSGRLGNRDKPDPSAEEDNSKSNDESSTKLDLMDASPRNDQDVRSTIVNIEKEHMFDKVVTPSDVGKLNRLVIPKQYAEKYFPLDSSTNEKGLLLNFDDRKGKSWRFRYSYWNSSQSYVMTKGWSRFVKDKKLEAGDIVSFQRGAGELGKDRLFIDWRRRPDAPPQPTIFSFHGGSMPAWSPLLMRPPPPAMARDHWDLSQFNRNTYHGGGYGHGYGYGYGYGSSNDHVLSPGGQMGSLIYLRSQPHNQSVVQMGLAECQHQQQQQQHRMVLDSVPVVQGKAAAKRLRLFGVNMECSVWDSDIQSDEFLSSTTSNIPIHTTTSHLQVSSSSSSFSTNNQSPLRLSLYNGTPLPLPLPPTDEEFLNKGKAPMSFDFGI